MSAYQPRLIDRAKVAPVLAELIERCGTAQKAAEYAGISKTAMYRMVRGHNEHVQRKTAARLVEALKRRREDDRKAGGNPAYNRAQRRRAIVEERLERETVR